MRNRFNYWCYFMKRRPSQTIELIVDTLGFILAIKILIQDMQFSYTALLNNTSISLLIVISFIKFLYDGYVLIKAHREYNVLHYGDVSELLIDIHELEVSKEEEKLGYIKEPLQLGKEKTEYILRSKSINDYLQSHSLSLSINQLKEKDIKQHIKRNINALLIFFRWQYRHSKFHGKGFFNEQKLCLAKDISPQENIISVSKGSYYDTYLTNIIAGKELRSNKDNAVFASTEQLFPLKMEEDKKRLLTITASMMNNEIGVSTIGITRDKYMVLWTQNRSAQSSNGLLVPTGSGSCDWSDRVDNDFKKTIAFAMQRELWEESGSKQLGKVISQIGETKVLGFFRWMSKAGKPEFVGITRLNCDFMSMRPNESEVFNREEIHVETAVELKEAIENLLKKSSSLSVPLRENLKVILDALADEKKKIELLNFLNYTI